MDKKLSRPTSSSPIHQLLDQLRDLQIRMESVDGNSGMNIIEAYDHFIRSSNKGRACTYSVKCEKLFIDNMYNDIKEHISILQELINSIEK